MWNYKPMHRMKIERKCSRDSTLSFAARKKVVKFYFVEILLNGSLCDLIELSVYRHTEK